MQRQIAPDRHVLLTNTETQQQASHTDNETNDQTALG